MERNKSIILACEIYPPDIGGPATYAYELHEQLLSHGYFVTLLTLGSEEATLAAYGEKGMAVVDRNKNVLIRSLVYFLRLWRLSKNTLVIYAMGPGVSGFCSVIAGWWRGKKVVVKVTGDRAWEAAQLQGSEEGIEGFQLKRHGGKVWMLEAIERWVVRHADAVVVPGNFLKKIVEGWGAKRGKIINIHNAISFLHPASHPMMKEGVRLEERKNLILAVGRLVPWKGIGDVIAALPKVREKVPDAALVIVGDGPERQHLQAIAREQGVTNHVDFQGSTPHNLLHNHWRRTKVFVLASGYEGFPHLVLEAWAAGVPVVASDIPANRDIIQNKANGLLVPYRDVQAIADALIGVMTDGRLARQLAEGGKHELEKYQWGNVYPKAEKVLFE